jgi:hypothetical protein
VTVTTEEHRAQGSCVSVFRHEGIVPDARITVVPAIVVAPIATRAPVTAGVLARAMRRYEPRPRRADQARDPHRRAEARDAAS